MAGTALEIHRLGSYRGQNHAPSPVAGALQAFKYTGDRRCGHGLVWLARCTARQFSPVGRPHLVPVPLSDQRLRARGFNQAAWLARGIAAALDLKVAAQLLRRTEGSGSQAGLGRTQRRLQRTKAVFEADARAVAGKQVLLVDDVVTTGSTLVACAAELERCGAREVRALTLLGVP